MYKISGWSWLLAAAWPLALGYGLAYIWPPQNVVSLTLGGLWLSGWLYQFVREQRSIGKFLLSSTPSQAPKEPRHEQTHP